MANIISACCHRETLLNAKTPLDSTLLSPYLVLARAWESVVILADSIEYILWSFLYQEICRGSYLFLSFYVFISQSIGIRSRRLKYSVVFVKIEDGTQARSSHF